MANGAFLSRVLVNLGLNLSGKETFAYWSFQVMGLVRSIATQRGDALFQGSSAVKREDLWIGQVSLLSGIWTDLGRALGRASPLVLTSHESTQTRFLRMII
jgi:hypothetical protein